MHLYIMIFVFNTFILSFYVKMSLSRGQMGPVLGIASLPSLAGTAVTVRLVSGEISVSAEDLRIVEAKRPLPEGSLSFPKSLTGALERFFMFFFHS